MKKISLFIVSIFAVSVSLAQTVEDFSFVPPTTDNNMSIVFPDNVLSAFLGGQVQAYVGEQPVSLASEIILNEDGVAVGGAAVIGADANCGGCPMANNGDEISFAILMNGEVIVITDVDPLVFYAPNSFAMVPDAANPDVNHTLTFSVDVGCTDAAVITLTYQLL